MKGLVSTREQGIGSSWLVSKELPPDCVQNLELSDDWVVLQDYQLATVVLDQMIWETKEVMILDFPKRGFGVCACVGECVCHNNPNKIRIGYRWEMNKMHLLVNILWKSKKDNEVF